MFITDYFKRKVDESNLKLSLANYEQMLPRFKEDSRISKNLFQIFLLGDDSSAEKLMSKLPPDFIANINHLKKNNPEYDYHLFGDQEAKEFIFLYYGATIWEYYQRIDGAYLAAKADFLRYLLLYALGGVYLDLKSTIEFPLADTIKEGDKFILMWPEKKRHHYLLLNSIEKGEMIQSFIISARGHYFMRAVILNVLQQIDLYNPYRQGTDWQGTLSTTGPAIYTNTVYSAIKHCSDKTAFREDDVTHYGYKMDFSGQYSPGIYQRRLQMKDYRRTSRPVIKCNNKYLQIINVFYLKILNKYVRLTRGKVK